MGLKIKLRRVIKAIFETAHKTERAVRKQLISEFVEDLNELGNNINDGEEPYDFVVLSK